MRCLNMRIVSPQRAPMSGSRRFAADCPHEQDFSDMAIRSVSDMLPTGCCPERTHEKSQDEQPMTLSHGTNWVAFRHMSFTSSMAVEFPASNSPDFLPNNLPHP